MIIARNAEISHSYWTSGRTDMAHIRPTGYDPYPSYHEAWKIIKSNWKMLHCLTTVYTSENIIWFCIWKALKMYICIECWLLLQGTFYSAIFYHSLIVQTTSLNKVSSTAIIKSVFYLFLHMLRGLFFFNVKQQNLFTLFSGLL